MATPVCLRGGPWACIPPQRRAARHPEALPCGSSRARRQQRPLPPAAAAGPQASAPQQRGAAEEETAPPAAWSDDMQAEFEDYQREQAAAAVEGSSAVQQLAEEQEQQEEQQEQNFSAEGGEQQALQGQPPGQWTPELEEEFQKYKKEQAAGELLVCSFVSAAMCTSACAVEDLGSAGCFCPV